MTEREGERQNEGGGRERETERKREVERVCINSLITVSRATYLIPQARTLTVLATSNAIKVCRDDLGENEVE